MNIVASPDFVQCIKTLTKKKYSNIYGCIQEEILKFLEEFNTFEKVWDRNYLLYENGFVRINKIRLENPLQNSGKSGGFRMIILCNKQSKRIAFLYIYPKTGPHGTLSIPSDQMKKFVKNYKEADNNGTLEIISTE